MSKNIRALQQDFAAARPKLKLHNSTFLEEVDRDLDRAKSPTEKRTLFNKIRDHARNVIDGPEGKTPAGTEVVNAWFAILDVLEAEISASGDGDRVMGGGVSAGGWFTENARGDREPIHVLAPTERVQDLPGRISASARDRPPLGDYLRGIVGGARNMDVRAALSEGTDSAGGYSIPTEVLGEFIDRLRAATCFVQAGARTVMLDGAKTRIMRVANDPVAMWRAENSAVNEGEPTFDALDFAPKSLACLVKVSNELLDDTVNAGDALVQALTAAMALKVDYAAFFGAGTGNEPRGLDNLVGVPTVTLGTGNGAQPTWDMLLDAEYQVDLGNGGALTAVVTHPRTWLTMRKLKSADGFYIGPPSGWAEVQDVQTGAWPDGRAPKRLKTTAFPINQTVGTSSDCATAHCGNFAKGIIGLRQELRIRRLDQAFAGNLQTGFLAWLRADIQFEQAAAFAKVKGIRA